MDHTHDDDLLELEPLPEGEEAPPPHVRTMAIVRWIILGAMSLFAVGMVLGGFGLAPWSQAAAKVTQYHCPMHPTYVSPRQGEDLLCREPRQHPVVAQDVLELDRLRRRRYVLGVQRGEDRVLVQDVVQLAFQARQLCLGQAEAGKERDVLIGPEDEEEE